MYGEGAVLAHSEQAEKDLVQPRRVTLRVAHHHHIGRVHGQRSKRFQPLLHEVRWHLRQPAGALSNGRRRRKRPQCLRTLRGQDRTDKYRTTEAAASSRSKDLSIVGYRSLLLRVLQLQPDSRATELTPFRSDERASSIDSVHNGTHDSFI